MVEVEDNDIIQLMMHFCIANSKQNIEKSEHQTPKSDTASAIIIYIYTCCFPTWFPFDRKIRDYEAIEEPPM